MQTMEHKASLWRDCLHFFYPDCCLCCGQRLIGTEKILCADCLGRLTYTGYENHERNPLNMRMKTKIPIRGASALLHFNKEGVIQKLLHVLKYQKQSEVGLFLGRLAGLRLIGQTPFCEADFLVPVPIHPKKLRKRGYNQSMLIAQGMNEILRKEISGDLLIKQERTQSQTKKSREARWANIQGSFCLNPEFLHEQRFHQQHFLLIDDVVTTGATSASCCQELLKIPGSQVSFFAIAHPE